MRLSSDEVINICNVIDEFRTDKLSIDEFCLKQHKKNLAMQLIYKEFPEGTKIEDVKKKVFEKFCNALVIPGIAYGQIAASSNSEPATQKVLKSSHAAGTEGKKGNATNETINCSNNPKDNWMLFRLSNYVTDPLSCENFINTLIVFNYKYVVKTNSNNETFSVHYSKNGIYISIKFSIENMIKSKHTIFDCITFLKENKINISNIQHKFDEEDGEEIFEVFILVTEVDQQPTYTTLLTFNLNNIRGITNQQVIKKDIVKDCIKSIIIYETSEKLGIMTPYLDRRNFYDKDFDKEFDDYIMNNNDYKLQFLKNVNYDEYFYLLQYYYDNYKNMKNIYPTDQNYNEKYIKYTLNLFQLCVSPKRIKYMLYKLFINNTDIKQIYIDYDIGKNISGFRIVAKTTFKEDLSDFEYPSRYLYSIAFDITDNQDAVNVNNIIEDNKNIISIGELTTANINTMYKLYGITAARHFAYLRWVELVSPKGEVPQMYIEILLSYSYEQFKKPFGIVRSADSTRNPLTLGAEGSILQNMTNGSLKGKKFPINDTITQNLTGSQSTIFGLNSVNTICNTDIGNQILKENNMNIIYNSGKSTIFRKMVSLKSDYEEPVD